MADETPETEQTEPAADALNNAREFLAGSDPFRDDTDGEPFFLDGSEQFRTPSSSRDWCTRSRQTTTASRAVAWVPSATRPFDVSVPSSVNLLIASNAFTIFAKRWECTRSWPG